MVNNPESKMGHSVEKEQPSTDNTPEQLLSTSDKIQQLIDENMAALQIADLRSETGGRELTRVIKKAEEMGYQRGFSEGVMEDKVKETSNNIVGYILAEIDNGSKTVSLAESTDEKDAYVTQKAMLRARKKFIDANLPAQVSFHTSLGEESNTLFNFNITIDLQAEEDK